MHTKPSNQNNFLQ